LGGKEDHKRFSPDLLGDRFHGSEKGLWSHDHPRSAAKRPVVHDSPGIRRKNAEVMEMDFDQPFFLGAKEDAPGRKRGGASREKR
jgi:hypothetical protein